MDDKIEQLFFDDIWAEMSKLTTTHRTIKINAFAEPKNPDLLKKEREEDKRLTDYLEDNIGYERSTRVQVECQTSLNLTYKSSGGFEFLTLTVSSYDYDDIIKSIRKFSFRGRSYISSIRIIDSGKLDGDKPSYATIEIYGDFRSGEHSIRTVLRDPELVVAYPNDEYDGQQMVDFKLQLE